MMQDLFIALAKDKKIRGRTRAVLDYLIGTLSFEEYTGIIRREISDTLDIDKYYISTAMKILCERGVLLKLPHLTAYKLNKNFGKSNVIAFPKAIAYFRRNESLFK